MGSTTSVIPTTEEVEYDYNEDFEKQDLIRVGLDDESELGSARTSVNSARDKETSSSRPSILRIDSTIGQRRSSNERQTSFNGLASPILHSRPSGLLSLNSPSEAERAKRGEEERFRTFTH